jgi:hypothetical protein
MVSLTGGPGPSLRWVVMAVSVVTIITTSCSSSNEGVDGTSPGTTLLADDGGAAWAELTSKIGPEGEISLELALESFALAIGPLPGVQTPEGQPGVFSGTEASRWVLQHWDGLTPEQEEAADEYLRSPLLSESAVSGGAATAGLLGVALLAPSFVAAQEGSPCVNDPAISAAVATMRSRIESHTGLPDTDIRACIVDESTSVSPRILLLNSEGGYKTGDVDKCVILIPEGLRDRIGSQLDEVLAYNIFGCFEAYLAATIETWVQLPAWLTAGSARWVAATLAEADPIRDGSWLSWLSDPTRPLFSRATDALGFFALMEETGHNPWDDIGVMLVSAIEGGGDGFGDGTGNYDAYINGIGFDRIEDTLNEWGPGYFQDPGYGDPWFFTGPGISGRKSTDGIKEATVTNGFQLDVVAEPFTVLAAAVDLQADVVVVGMPPGFAGGAWTGFATQTLIDNLELVFIASAELLFTRVIDPQDPRYPSDAYGLVRLPDGSELALADLGNIPICTLDDGCACPPGSPGESRSAYPTEKGVASFGLTGHTDGSQVQLSGLSLEDFCGSKPNRNRERFSLTLIEWDWEAVGGADQGGCIWPAASDTFTRVFAPFDGSAPYIEFDTSSYPWKYKAYITTDAMSQPVTVEECVRDGIKHRRGFEHTYIAGATWIAPPDFADPWMVMTGNVVTGTWKRGDDTISTWTLSRSG